MMYDINGNLIVVNNGENPILNGKTWFPIGDSVTNGGSYRDPIKTQYEMVLNSGGYGDGYQCGYGSGATFSILEKINNFPSNAPDIITIALGTNDFGNSCPLGTIDDNPDLQTPDNYTFYGCYKKLLKSLYEKYGRVPTLLITPFQRNGGSVKNSDGHTLKDYADAIIDIGGYYSIKVCDMYRESGISIGTLSEVDDKIYTSDGLHLNNIAGGIVSPKIADYMKYVFNEWVFECLSLSEYTGGNFVGNPVTIAVGSSVKVYATRYPSWTTYPMEWETSNPEIASVSDNLGNIAGRTINGVSKGSCTVTVTCGSQKFVYAVTVS